MLGSIILTVFISLVISYVTDFFVLLIILSYTDQNLYDDLPGELNAFLMKMKSM